MQVMKAQNAPYLLRWRLEFRDRPAVFGMWNNSAISAWDKNREGLSKAIIECKSTKTHITNTVVECEGHEFRNFQWVAVTRVNPNFKGSVSPRPETVGIKLLTENEEVAILVNGQGSQRPLSEAEKNIQFATFGR